MAIQPNDILEVSIHQSYAGQNFINVMHLAVEAVDLGIASDEFFLENYAQIWKDAVKLVQTTDVQYVKATLKNLTDPLYEAEYDMAGNGSVAGDTLPTYVAMRVSQKRATTLTRSGMKRISGLPESVCSQNTITVNDPAKVALQSLFGTSFQVEGGTVEQSNMVLISNVILGRTKDVNGNYQIDLSKVNNVSSVTVNSDLTSQLSRKN